ncbi:hypothetical protein E5983_05150 [Streptococcus danieliae]|uniref:Uncharacterized protein n=1 Tax=Streptococcus danieliae TaxID=747656 RepID=A0A7X3G8J8_9STRE|nr:hypothetical protein [Streptococcus danieliae]MVX59032.1 hypothetical protein [Streptococcus danieliae]
MKYAIFSFAEGDYLFDENNCLLVFESKGLAYQYMKARFRKPEPIQRTKRVIQFTEFYQAPFRIQKVC